MDEHEVNGRLILTFKNEKGKFEAHLKDLVQYPYMHEGETANDAIDALLVAMSDPEYGEEEIEPKHLDLDTLSPEWRAKVESSIRRVDRHIQQRIDDMDLGDAPTRRRHAEERANRIAWHLRDGIPLPDYDDMRSSEAHDPDSIEPLD